MVELVLKASSEDINMLRKMVLEKLESYEGTIHPKDLDRLKKDDKWLDEFLSFSDYNMKISFKSFWDSLLWRWKNRISDISEDNLRMDYLLEPILYVHGRCKLGHKIIRLKIKNHIRGSKNMEDLMRVFIYWYERALREENNNLLVLVIDMEGAGLLNLDLELIKSIVNVLKCHYPETLKFIIVYDMPWIMNGAFQIIKKLMPKKGVEALRNLNSKNVREYIDEDNMPVEWGGKDDYVYKFVPEAGQNDKYLSMETLDDIANGNHHMENNNHNEEENLNLMHRKVHFANNLSESPSPISELSTSSFETRHEMLQLSPPETIVFQKNAINELLGNVHILNSSKKAVTYKVKTTAPDKFRVRPSSGTLSPMTSANINVVVQKGHTLHPVSKDKFLVMCMALPDGEPLTADEIANMWKEVTANSPEVEQHRLKCTVPTGITTAIISNPDIIMTENYIEPHMMGLTSSMTHNGTKQSVQSNQHLNATINQLSETVHLLNQQIKSQQSLQWITLFVFIMVSIAIVYILKMEIQNSNSQYCIDK